MQMNSQACPPGDAEPASGVYYRCCCSCEPDPRDFKSASEEGTWLNMPPCSRKSLSLTRTLEDALQMTRLVPRRRWKYVKKAELTGSQGHTLPTPGQVGTHTSWWPSEGLGTADRAALFSLVTGDQE